ADYDNDLPENPTGCTTVEHALKCRALMRCQNADFHRFLVPSDWLTVIGTDRRGIRKPRESSFSANRLDSRIINFSVKSQDKVDTSALFCLGWVFFEQKMSAVGAVETVV